MRKAYLVLFILSIAILIGCAGQLAVKQMMAEPSEVSVGSEVKIMVTFTGQKNAISTVIGTVRENPEMFFSLNDDGEDGDETAGDDTWSYTAPVPWDAQPYTYHLDIRARDLDGNEIISEGFEQQSTGRSGTIEITVK